MKVVHELDEQVWRDFVDHHPEGQIFHTPEMFQVFSRAKGYKPALWAVVDEAHHPLALFLPVFITLKNGLFYSLTTRAVSYGSILCVPGPEGREALKTLVQEYKHAMRGRMLFTEIRNLSDISGHQPILNEYDFTFEEHLNFLIDLNQNQEEIWKKIKSNARRNIKKSLTAQVNVYEIDSLEGVSQAYILLKNTYERLQVPLADRSLFQSAFEILNPIGRFKTYISKIENTDTGIMTLLFYKNIVYYWYAGMVKEYSSFRSGDLMVWHALQIGCQNGYQIFDFGGAGKPGEVYGVRDFKAKFGGRLVNYGRNTCIHSPFQYKVSKQVYSLMRKGLSLQSIKQKPQNSSSD